jgi:hypothetical protein
VPLATRLLQNKPAPGRKQTVFLLKKIINIDVFQRHGKEKAKGRLQNRRIAKNDVRY